MSRIEIRFAIPGEKSFARMWNDLAHVPDDMSPAFSEMANQFRKNNAATFNDEGPGWKPLAMSTSRDKARKGFGSEPILVRSGRLRDSLTVQGADGAIEKIQRQYFEIGTSVEYAIYHQTGNLKPARIVAWGHDTGEYAAPGTHPPKRPPIVMRAALRTAWQRTISTYLREQMDIAVKE